MSELSNIAPRQEECPPPGPADALPPFGKPNGAADLPVSGPPTSMPPHASPRLRSSRSIVVYLPDLSGGGAERLHIRLAPYLLEAGHHVTILLDHRGGELLAKVPAGCQTHILDAPRQIRALPKLIAYLRRTRPDLLIANMEHMNVMAIAARRLAGVSTRIVVSQHSTFSDQITRGGWQFRVLPALYRMALPFADRIIAVSRGVADELSDMFALPRSAFAVIHNGVVDDDIDERTTRPAEHPWFRSDAPIILGMGRLVPQKDFSTLIRAFSQIADRSDARLVILGEGPLRGSLEEQARSLGHLSARICLPGFIDDPLPMLRRAKLFVLSSRGEGFANVLAEALACGTPVVSTDCPYGPGEILEGGRYGRLVPVGDAEAMGKAMLASLQGRHDPGKLMRRGRSFSIARCADAYLDLIDDLLPPAPLSTAKMRGLA